MDDFVMKSKWTILHMWIILLGYTGIDPTSCTESTLWYPSSHEKARKLLSEDWLWMGLSWKSSFWSRKLFLQLHVGTNSVLTPLFYQTGTVWTTDQQIQIPSLKKTGKIVDFTGSTWTCDSLPCSCICLPIINHLNLHLTEISDCSVRRLMWVDFGKCRKVMLKTSFKSYIFCCLARKQLVSWVFK